MKRIAVAAAVGLLLLAGAGAIGCAIGNKRSPVETVQTGTLYETSNEGTASAGGFNYLLPVDVSWIDAMGTIHDGSQRPPCLRLDHASRGQFATVKYGIAGATQGTVVWVRC
jgi:hypothetical protein